MSWSVRVALGLAVCSAWALPLSGEEPAAKKKAKVELRWVESQRIEGITEDKGFPASCAADDLVYAHKKPALVLTSAEVSETRLSRLDFGGAGVQFLVTLHLTKAAREKLAAAAPGKETRMLTVVVDGHPWGVRRYETDKDKPAVPEQVRAETFLPDVGFFPSEADARRLMEAFE